MDSVPASREGQGRAQRLFRVQGQILLYGCASLGETARSVDPRSAESVRHNSCGDRRLFADNQGRLLDFCHLAFKKFFLREFEADQPEAVARLITELGLSDRHYLEYLAGEGRAAYERCQEEAATDHVFGVPFFMFADEPFWGYDRLGLLEQRLTEAGLEIGDKVTAA